MIASSITFPCFRWRPGGQIIPDSPPRLSGGSLACGVDETALDEVVKAARHEGNCYRIPACAKVLRTVAQDLRTMAAPVVTEQGVFAQRLEGVLARLPVPSDDLISRDSIQEIARAGDGVRSAVRAALNLDCLSA